MGALLETIHSPADLKRLNPAQMADLAEEIRAFLIQTSPRPAAIWAQIWASWN